MPEIQHPGTDSPTPRYVYVHSYAKGPRQARRPYDHHGVVELAPGTRADDSTIALDGNRKCVARIVRAFYTCNRGKNYPDGTCESSRARRACLERCEELNREAEAEAARVLVVEGAEAA